MKFFSFFRSRRSLGATITELRGKVATLSLDNKQLEEDIKLVSSQLDRSQRDLERAEGKWRNDGLHKVETVHALRMALEFIDVWSDKEWAEKVNSDLYLTKGKSLKAYLTHELTTYLMREPDARSGLYNLDLILKSAGLDKRVPDGRCRFVAKLRAEEAIVEKFEDYDPSLPFDMFDYLNYLDIKTPEWRRGKPLIEIVDRVEAMKTAAAMKWEALDYLGVVTVERIDSKWGYDRNASDYSRAVSKAGNAGLFVEHPTHAAELRKNYYAVAAALLQAEIDHLMQAHGVGA